jgi:hypothetical protein
MLQNRLFLPGLLVLLLLLWGAWQIYAGWGLVTLDVRDTPLSKVLNTISRQGGIDIASNLDPTTPVTIQVKRLPPVEALDLVAARVEASWLLAFLGAPTPAAINSALDAFRVGGTTPGWTSYGGGGFSMVEPQSGAALDLRRVNWTPSAAGELPALLEEASQKTGVFLAAPADWKPATKAPRPGPIAQAAPQLFRNAGGVTREVFLLRGRPSREDDDMGGGGGGPWIGSAPATASGQRGGGSIRAMGDPQQVAERIEAQIALLPANEQDQAREDFRTMRDFWQGVRELPEEERRAKAREFFSRPEIAERMDDRRLAREAKMAPQQRVDRAKRYFERKQAAQSASPGNP